MEEGQHQLHKWEFTLAASPAQLWEYISDTNRLFRIHGATPIKEISLSRNTPKGFLELSHNSLKSYVNWIEEPFTWEAPYRFGVKRRYKSGILKDLKISTESIPTEHGTRLVVKIWIFVSKAFFSLPVKLYVDYLIKRRLNAYLHHIEKAITGNQRPYELSSSKKLVRGAEKKLKEIEKELKEVTNRKRIVDRLISLIKYAEDEDLECIHPYAIAEYWGEKKYSVLNVFLHATKLNLLDFSWNICCPTCKSPKNNFRKMQEARVHLYCEECESDYTMDFNRNTHLVFKAHPLIRKISDRVYCMGGPGNKPHRIIQQHLNIGDERYPQLSLDVGTYLFRTYNHEGHLVFHVREDGTDNINLYLTDDELDGSELVISRRPNLAIFNHSSKSSVCFIDKLNWKEEAIYATEVSSSVDFTKLFSQEILKETSKVKASDVTFLFTDLMNSTELYIKEGDESAIGRVMGHFKLIQQIVAEERGGIVKTLVIQLWLFLESRSLHLKPCSESNKYLVPPPEWVMHLN
ncbi:DUF5939 domain-containing protein [Gracilimonas sp.]|uniref:DUF5939 domain-containing protein n=1 Tax=Gracilimonas sp. TaxID=1974203 RepID=UPI002870D7FB|nr:DUF5939 domain-containing protein [Gracilimonas sp.]